MQFKKLTAVTAGALLALAAPSLAQTVAAAGLTVGATVYGSDGASVGTVEKIDGETVTINTGTQTAALGSAAFSKGPNGPSIGMTKAKLNEAISTAQQQDKAKLDAALVVGATARSSDGQQVGTIQALNPDGTVVIKGTSQSFALPRDIFAVDASGLMLRITAQQLTDALAKSAPASAPSAEASPAPTAPATR